MFSSHEMNIYYLRVGEEKSFLFHYFYALAVLVSLLTSKTKQKHYEVDRECLPQRERKINILANQNNFDTRTVETIS